MHKKLEQLKDDLQKSLSQDDLNFQEILGLANELALMDQENVRFSIDASHIAKLGQELVAKQETAVAELVKNAYDADATTVDLIFTNSEQPGGSLEVIDNGTGMTRDELINGFMRISTAGKVASPTSRVFGRRRAGRKGIGRFSTQRLGKKLTITTQAKDASKALEITIDWDMFEESQDLIVITNTIREIEKLPHCGTTLRIQDLRDSWSQAQIQRSYRYISELLQPFPISKKSDPKPSDPGFKVAFYGENKNDLITIADENSSIFQHALAELSGKVVNSEAYWSCISSKYKINIKNQKLTFDKIEKQKQTTDNDFIKPKYDELDGIHFKAYYFIAAELPSGGTKSYIRELLTNHGGIRIYRNGFRVLPYGEAYDDWLGLQKSSALRQLLPPHHNANFFGLVEIIDPDGERFNETSSREGLIENQAFKQLQDFVYRALVAGVSEIARYRKKKVLASDKIPKPTAPQEEAEEIVDLLNKAIDRDSNAGGSSESELDPDVLNSGQLKQELVDRILGLGTVSQNMLEEIGMLRVLAALGITIGEFTHEIRHSLGAAIADVSILEDASNIDYQSRAALASMQSNLQMLQAYARYFDDAIIDNTHRQLVSLEIRDVIQDFEKVITPSLDRQHIKFSKEIDGYDLFTRPMHKSEWASILLNLFTNSLKAIRRAKSKGAIFLKAGIERNNLFLEFSDNGDGIPEANRDKIFDAFFTTSAPSSALSNDQEQLTGTGLGLKIVNDIVEGAEGEIYLTSPPPGFSTCFRVEIPKAKEEEIPKDAY